MENYACLLAFYPEFGTTISEDIGQPPDEDATKKY